MVGQGPGGQSIPAADYWRSIEESQQLSYVGFLSRHPFASDAFEFGYAVGHREDYEYRTHDYPNVDLPTIILDNDFRDPDIDRYLTQFDTYDPSVAILGDAYTPAEAEGFNAVVKQLRNEFPYRTYVVVPKCERAFDILDQDVVLGYPMGYSDVQADDYSEREDWRGRKVHLLGASPPKQYAVMQELTQPNLRDDPPADIVGVDWNGPHKVAYLGEYWSRDGWQPADHLSIRATVRESLWEMKRYWQDRGVWPETEPVDLYGPAVLEPDNHLYMDAGGDPIGTREDLEAAYVEAYERGTWAFQSESQKSFIEHREDLTSV